MECRFLGLQPYGPVYQNMVEFNRSRTADTVDELWFLQHERVFTQGQAGKAEHVLAAGDIPVVQTDRGGQVTYHGPGQLVVYLMIDIKRRQWGPRQLVSLIEDAIVDTLSQVGIDSAPKADAPGVYVEDRKIASLGLRITKGCSFHGLALNVDMDLEPFSRINPCGFAGMQMTDIAKELHAESDLDHVSLILQKALVDRFSQC